MNLRFFQLLLFCLAPCLAMSPLSSNARPLTPASDTEVVQTLPTDNTTRRAERAQRQALARSPRAPVLAVAAAESYLNLARAQGDARAAGLALGALQTWEGAAQVPTEVLVTRATVAQYLHDFSGAEAMLKRAVQQQVNHPQAWLTLATVQRVGGHYAASDASCEGVLRSGQRLHGLACLAENQSLRGEQDAARAQFQQLLQTPRLPSGTQQWLLTSVAEPEARAGRPDAARAAWLQAVALGASGYTLDGYLDFLLDQGEPKAVLALLTPKVESPGDAALLRLAIAGKQTADPRAVGWRTEMAARIEASRVRPGGAATHAREQARFALDVLNHPGEALALARENLKLQREPVDLGLLARTAAAQTKPAERARAEAEFKQWR
ncbi:MAG: hypothetical protein H7242_09680, partial [Microbacteriaceae bacterium]|nr:hypothetical protein [Burkholderiaceae bacterium]